jgi:hypothetical protein
MRVDNCCTFLSSSTSIFQIGSGKQIFVKILVDGDEREALIDSGAGLSIMGKNCIATEKITQAFRRYHLVTANGDTINVRGMAMVELKIGTLVINRKLIVVDE